MYKCTYKNVHIHGSIHVHICMSMEYIHVCRKLLLTSTAFFGDSFCVRI